MLALILISSSLPTSLAAGEGVDVEIFLLTPFGTPMVGAVVEVTRPDGVTVMRVADAWGRIIVRSVPLGVVSEVTVLSWKGMPVDYKVRWVSSGTIVVERIGKLTVRVVGTRGQSLEGAEVKITRLGEVEAMVEMVDYAGPGGMLAIELPEGRYCIEAKKAGRAYSRTVQVNGGKNTLLTLMLDIFASIFGWEVSLADFIGLLLLIFVVALIIAITAHEYLAWRRRRLYTRL